MDSTGKHNAPAHSVLDRVSAPAVHALPTVLPAIGASTQVPDAASHLRVPQSASLTHRGMHAKTVSAALTGRQTTSAREWHLAMGS
jgi:hypothetical protein